MGFSRLQVSSSAVQVHEYLRGEIAAGRLSGVMPGVLRLERELGVSRRALMAAVGWLEQEGVIEGQGAGRRRRIVPGAVAARAKRRSLRVMILPYDEGQRRSALMLEILYQMRIAGMDAAFADGSLKSLGMDTGRVASLVEASAADAWVVAAASREVLEWFSGTGRPVIAVFGRHLRLPIPGVGPRFAPAMEAMARRLAELGHRRIVLLVHRERRVPRPGPPERAFLGELMAQGIAVGRYTLPDWREDKEGFLQCLDALFELTPPTAVVLSEPFLYFTALQYLTARGLAVPRDVSMVCLEQDPVFAWSEPEVAHIRWDERLVARSVLRWAENIAHGRDDHTKTPIKARFVEGGTLGRAP